MFGQYLFNSQADDKGRHEVHISTCSYLPSYQNQQNLGYHGDCHSAIASAKSLDSSKYYDGCFWCCRECHKG